MVEVQVLPCSSAALQNRRGEARLDHAGRADPECGKHRIGQRVGVEQRQIGLVHVALMQILMDGVDLGTPQRVGMRPQHRLRPRCRARGVLHAARRQRIGRPPRPIGAVGKQRFEALASFDGRRLRLTRIVRDHGDPFETAAMRCDHLGIGRLRDRSHRATVLREVAHLGGCRARVGRDGERAQLDAGKPGKHRLDAIVEMDQHGIAGLDAALDQPGRQCADTLVKLAIGPAARRCLERRRDQERMIAPGLAAQLQQPRHVHAVERRHRARCHRRSHHLRSRRS